MHTPLRKIGNTKWGNQQETPSFSLKHIVVFFMLLDIFFYHLMVSWFCTVSKHQLLWTVNFPRQGEAKLQSGLRAHHDWFKQIHHLTLTATLWPSESRYCTVFYMENPPFSAWVVSEYLPCLKSPWHWMYHECCSSHIPGERYKMKGCFNQEKLIAFLLLLLHYQSNTARQADRPTQLPRSPWPVERPVFMWVIHKGRKSPHTVARDKVLVIYVTPGPPP